jgi:hypothetical protein
MANRNFTSQSLHDLVIQEAVIRLNSVDFGIYTNPNNSRNAGIGDKYPDIIMTEKGTTTVKFIIEVETDETINITEANNQWKKYATEINASFYLLVPFSRKSQAISLCKQVGISVRFATYQVNSFNNITQINFE